LKNAEIATFGLVGAVGRWCFTDAALSSGVRVGEVDVEVDLFSKGFVLRHLAALSEVSVRRIGLSAPWTTVLTGGSKSLTPALAYGIDIGGAGGRLRRRADTVEQIERVGCMGSVVLLVRLVAGAMPAGPCWEARMPEMLYR
jgi:hypothetical protein